MEGLLTALITAAGTIGGAGLGAWINSRRHRAKTNGIADVRSAIRYLQEIERLKHELSLHTGRYD